MLVLVKLLRFIFGGEMGFGRRQTGCTYSRMAVSILKLQISTQVQLRVILTFCGTFSCCTTRVNKNSLYLTCIAKAGKFV